MTSGPDTIVAVATAPGRGGIGVVRLSGSPSSVAAIARQLLNKSPSSRRAMRCRAQDGDGEPLDDGIALLFPAPFSYTGEEVLEFHGHGNPILLAEIVRRCVDLGARPAEPGEFTQRAFVNGKLDLAQAEAVADLIGATTSRAAKGALRSLDGAFSESVHRVERSLIHIRKLIEAHLDFAEEEIPLDQAGVTRLLEDLLGDLAMLSASARQGQMLRDGVNVALVGAPNVGKSSLLNALAGADLAIVTPIAGTTRDVIRADIELDGVRFTVMDTAGLRESDDPVEREGIERTQKATHAADLILLMEVDGSPQHPFARTTAGTPVIRVWNKIDLTDTSPGTSKEAGDTEVWLSVKTGAGLDELRQCLIRESGAPGAEEGTFVARARHLAALGTAKQGVARALTVTEAPELCAEELRMVQNALNSITGEFLADDLLGEIFRDFCIGK